MHERWVRRAVVPTVVLALTLPPPVFQGPPLGGPDAPPSPIGPSPPLGREFPRVPVVIRGTAGDDVLTGTAGDDLLLGGSGDDRLSGGAGRDHVYGGPGHDRLIRNRRASAGIN
jgi:hypothetical protein